MARSEGGSARSRIAVDLPESTRRRLRTLAARRDLTLQEYVRRAVERQLAEDAPSDLRAEDDPVFGELWSNDADSVYARRREAVPWREVSRALETCRADALLLDDLRAAVPDTTADLT